MFEKGDISISNKHFNLVRVTFKQIDSHYQTFQQFDFNQISHGPPTRNIFNKLLLT